MKKIFPNLYRFDSKPRGKSGEISYSYLIVRRQGNLLICNHRSLVSDYLDEIESLGGIDTQFIARYVDSKRGDYHEMLYSCFGCKLCYHEDERKMTRTKTKCPEITFGDEGLKMGTDFEAHFFPNKRWTGTCLFRWQYRGKSFLFTNDIVKQRDDEWEIRFEPELWPDKRSMFTGLPKLQVDYILPGQSAALGEDIHRFTGRTTKSFSRAIQTKLEPRQGGLKTGITPRRLRLVTNWVSGILGDAIKSLDLYEINTMKVHGNCALPLFFTYLEDADVMLFQNFMRKFRSDHPYLGALREHVEKGGGLLLADNRGQGDERQIVSCHPFPEVGVTGKPYEFGDDVPELAVDGKHPITSGLKDKTRFNPAVHVHSTPAMGVHRHLSYEGRTFEPGSDGQVLVRNGNGNPVLVAGQVGKGRVVMSGFYYGSDVPIEGPERQIYLGALRWLSGLDS